MSIKLAALEGALIQVAGAVDDADVGHRAIINTSIFLCL
jgi:hypothetical protein